MGRSKRRKIGLFGHFGAGNFGNEITLQAMLCHIRRLLPDAEITCICSAPEIVAAEYRVAAVAIIGVVVKPWDISNPLARLLRKLFIGLPSELYRWLKGVWTLRGTDSLVIVGTGLLTDAYSLGGWGPYSTFKWSVIAKLCRCQLRFVSVGAGPLRNPTGRLLVKSALSLADFRSYRDDSTVQHLKEIGFRTGDDRVYPDLAFSVPVALLPTGRPKGARRLIVGLGLMERSAMYGLPSVIYAAYLETLADFVKWLWARDYEVRLLIGDLTDTPVTLQFKSLLGHALLDEDRIIYDPIASVNDLLSRLATTDLVVATRFHNVLLALLLNKPSIAISFHHKCSSLMNQMGLSHYCQDIKQLNLDGLIKQFCDLETNAESLALSIRGKAEEFRRALDEQYDCIFQ